MLLSVISKAKFVSQKITLQLINSYASESRHHTYEHTLSVDMVFVGATKRAKVSRGHGYFIAFAAKKK